jgi:hypothetical protein
MRYAPGVQIVLLRNFIFGVLIGAIPALLPVVGPKALHLDAVNLGLTFTSMGLGSLAGGVFILEPARKRLKPNQMTILGGIALAVVYALMAVNAIPRSFSWSQRWPVSLGQFPPPSSGWRDSVLYRTGSEAG